MPDDKVEASKKRSKQEGVAVVGDVLNDAPAMVNAAAGSAMGAAGWLCAPIAIHPQHL